MITRYAVICPNHGQVFITFEEYMEQLDKPDSFWKCTKCNQISEFDDNNYESIDEIVEENE
jgi:Fe2+ or Zn2+ uptake regulation protein